MTKVIQVSKIVGPRGKSAYEIAVDYGYSGSEEDWLNSLKATLPMGEQYADMFLTNDGETVWWKTVYNQPHFQLTIKNGATSGVVTLPVSSGYITVNAGDPTLHGCFYFTTNSIIKMYGGDHTNVLDGVSEEGDITLSAHPGIILIENKTGNEITLTVTIGSGQ